MPAFDVRSTADEMMDDFSITDERLRQALDEIRWVNRLLGGYRATMDVLGPYLTARAGPRLRLLDVGTGVADFPEHFVRWADRRGVDLEVVALDANAATVEHARSVLRRRLPGRLAGRVQVVVGDALALPFEDDAFDVVTASLFTHHFSGPSLVRVVREMARVGRDGILVNDLHRHPGAYYGIAALAAVLPVSPMFRHDGPVSVLRAFKRRELERLGEEAGLAPLRIHWYWAFRWILTTLPEARLAGR